MRAIVSARDTPVISEGLSRAVHGMFLACASFVVLVMVPSTQKLEQLTSSLISSPERLVAAPLGTLHPCS